MEPLPHSDLLTTMGEVGAAFIGFSMVAGVLRPESHSGMRRFFRFRHVAEMSLGSVVASFLPLFIHAYGTSHNTTWFFASALVLIPGIVGPIVNWREVGVSASYNAEPARTVVSLALCAVGIILPVSNLVHAGPSSGARYSTVVASLLALAGLTFIGATFGTSKEPPAG